MNESLVSYSLDDSVATITMDDGKVNALSPAMIASLGEALDQAEAAGAVVVLTGRQGVFSAGFDLGVLRGGAAEAIDLVMAGMRLGRRLLAFPTPVVIACSGHAVAMGSFMLLSGDYRIGARGPFRITANEVAIGMVIPTAAIEICRSRLTPAQFNRATMLAEVFSPDDAVPAGFLDRVVEPEDLADTAGALAGDLSKLNMSAHLGTKLRARDAALKAIDEAIVAEGG